MCHPPAARTSTGCRSTATSRPSSCFPTTRRAAATGASARSATTASPRSAPREYRERPSETVLDHLEALKKKHGARIFYFSQDVFSPRIATSIARGIMRARARRALGHGHAARALAHARALPRARRRAARSARRSASSAAAPRVLSLIDKGIPVEDVARRRSRTSRARASRSRRCASRDFPTETYREAMRDRALRRGRRRATCRSSSWARFDLTHGSLVAQKPGEFGIKEVWRVEGDELGTGLFFAERRAAQARRPTRRSSRRP